MREYLDPIYFQHPFQTGSSSSERYQPGKASSSSVKKSNSVLNGGSVSSSVLGKFLKIAKSKSDVQGRPKSRASTYNGYDVEEDFRLSPSVLHRGPVEKMVHKSNSRKDVSRSHSWIYGSVKLPSDLPFGYGYSIGGGNHSHSPSGSDNSNSGGSGSPTGSHHTHGMTALSIPRCQMVDYYNPSCDCNFTGDFDFLTAGPNESNPNNNGPCKACICEWTVSPSKNSKGRKPGSKVSDSGFVNSVRKLTWKSLKQAVKKRPSLDNLKRPNELRGGSATPTPFITSPSGPDVFTNPNGIPVVLGSHGDLLEGNPPFYHAPSPQHAFSADDLQPSYFFPEKKNMYASCTDIYREPPPHVTASVRIRPKPSRQSWDFPTEFGPVPNYQEDELYHSEWDLRQCIPYDVWVSTTSHVKPRSTMSSNGRSKTPTPEVSSSKNASLSKSTSVPYLSASSSSKSQSSTKALSSNGLKSKSSSSGLINGSSSSSNRASDTLSVKSIESSKGSSNGKGSYRSPSAASNGVVKRPSILSSDVNAYQLLKAQTRNAKNSSTTSTTRRTAVNKTARINGSKAKTEGDLSDALSSSSDDLSDNVLTSESHMRIAGQKIYMAPNLNGNQNTANASSSLSSRGTVSSNSSSSSKSSGFSDPKMPSKAKVKGLTSVDIDEWSDDDESRRVKQHVSMNRDRVPNKANKTSMMSREHIQNMKPSKSVRSTQNGTQFGLNNSNYNNCRENNGAHSGFSSGDNSGHISSTRVGQSIPSPHNGIGSNQTHINQHSQRDSDSLNGNECLEFEEYEFEEHPPSSSRTANFHNQNKSTISKPTHELSSSSSAEDSRSCGNDLASNVEKSTTPIMRNPLANPCNQPQRAQSYVKKGQSCTNTTPTSTSGNMLYGPINGSTNGAGNSTSHNGSAHKLNGLRRRKSRNGSNNPGKLLREVIYEEEVEHEPSSLNETMISHGNDSGRSEMGGYVHDSSQSSNKSTEYAVKIVVSHTGSSGSEYVKPILKNRERVYDTPTTLGPKGSLGSHERSVGFGSNNNDIYFDSSVSTISKKKVQFDQNKVVVCGGDSGPDSDEFSMNEDEATQEKLDKVENNVNNDFGNEEHEDERTAADPDCWKSKGNNESPRNYNHHYQSNEESGSVSLKSNLSRKLPSTSNHDNLGPNQSEELKQKPKSLFEEEVARKAASFALSRIKKAAEEAEAEKAIKNDVASSHEECYDRSVNNLQKVRLNNETEMRLTSSVNSRTNMTTFATARSNLKSINIPNATTTGVGSKPSVSRNSQGTGSIVKNPEPTQPPCGNKNDTVDVKSPLANKAEVANKAFSHKPTPPKTSHGVTSNAMKTQRTPGISESSKMFVLNEGPTEQQKIINPNSLLFNDTTRIRLNQSRPSLNETFKLNLTQNGQGSRHGSAHQTGPVARSIRIKQSNSFRSIGSAPLRPKEPPPPPPTALQKLGVKFNTRLQKSISTSALAVQSDKELKKSLSTNQLSHGHGSHYGNRLLTKSEISLPIALQSTSNQASLKNENIYGQKDNKSVNINGLKSPSGSSETNNSKTPLGAKTNLIRSKASTTSNSTSSLSSRSKSLTDRCEALDKVLGQQHKAKANASNQQQNNKICGGSHVQLRNNGNRNNTQKEVMIEGKVQKHEPQSGETLRNSGGQSATMTSSHPSQPHVTSKSSSQQLKSITPLQTSATTMDAQQSQNIEIVTKENSVSEIRIYSTGNNVAGITEAKEIYGATKTIISNNGMKQCDNSAVQEIHYAATDLFPTNEFLNGRNQFRKPAPMPQIPTHESNVSQTRPQSTSVVLIIDNNNGRNESSKVVPSSSPITYSQPIDTLAQAPFKELPPPPVSPKGVDRTSGLTSQGSELGFCNNNDCNLETEEGDDDMSEPLYDDVINHTLAADLTTKGTSSIGKSSIISSTSSRKSNGRKSILDQSINRPSQLPPEPPKGQILSSTLPCMACPPSLPPPNLPSKNLSEFQNRPIILNEDEGTRGNMYNDASCDMTLDEEVDNLYNDISDGGVSSSNNATGKSLQSFASSMKGALLSAIKSMDFDRRSIISSTSNNSNGSTKKDDGLGKARDSACDGEDVIYDDTLSIRSSNCGADTSRTYYHATFTAVKPQAEMQSHSKYQSIIAKPLANLIEQDEPLSDEADCEPLYDDVINMPAMQNRVKSKDGVNSSSDSGAESEDATPPPLPAQGPPIHLRSKLVAELPVIPFPLTSIRSEQDGNRAFDDSGSEMSRESSMEKVIGIVDYGTSGGISTSITSANVQSNGGQNIRSGEDALITKTRSLLNELNEKLSQLNIISPDASSSSGSRGLLNVDFSSLSPHKAAVSSSSESSGVEEDYNSEKNYSLSNTSDAASGSSAEENYKLAQVSKLVTETITMARGKFLNSMKSNNNNCNASPLLILSPNGSTNNGETTESPIITEEPIYEEIGDMNRPTSPIYSDAFDAKSIFDGASRNEILSFLESIRDRLTTTSDSNSSESQSSSVSSKKGHESNSRNDSGIGPDALLALNNALLNASDKIVIADKEESKLVLRKLCPDCNDVPVDCESNPEKSPQPESTALHHGITLCLSCNRKRSERKEIIMEIHETEMKYGRDLQIITEEFYKPIQIAGLLSKDQLDQIFLNVVELMEISAQLTSLLKGDIESACAERNDEDLTSVNVGKIFHEIGESMMTAFQTYCTRQASAGALLAQLEKEKELLRIFLRVSQMENTVLRRMNLPAFLMVPVQRVTRYPLLLSRLLKVTPVDHFTREELQSAHEKIELHLEHMNKSTREVASVKLWRRISIINGNSTPLPRRATNELEGASVSIRKMAVDVLDWATLQDVNCVMDNQLSLVHFNGKPLRGIYGCLLVRGKDLETIAAKMDDDMFFPPAEDIVKEVKLVLVRVKNTRFCLLREPLCLSNCVISQGENEFQDFVEINEISSKNTYHLQGIDKQATANWLKYMQCYSMCVGQWRKRRIGLANIMMMRHL